MKIGINLLTLTQERFGGVEQYIKNLIAYLADSGENLTLFLFLSKKMKNIFPPHEKIQIRTVKDPAQIHECIRQCQLDLWFCPVHKSYIPNIRVPCIVTIHDVLHTAYPDFVQGGREENNRYYHQFAPSFNKVITVSAFSRNAIANQLSIPKEKIHAIHPSAPAIFDKVPADVIRKKVKQKYQLPETYAIYPSSFNPHKNHQNLLKAILILREKYKTFLPLVLTGYADKKSGIYRSVLRFIKEHSLENHIRVLGYIKPDEMPSLYWNSSFLVFPSLYEGFGIPLVEALKAQRPIVCSNRGSIPEIAGDAALYFNPESPEEMALIMKEMLNPLIRERLREEGRLRSQQFSWKKTAEETLHVFRSVIKKR